MEGYNFEWLEGIINRVLNPAGKESGFGSDNLKQLLEWIKPEGDMFEQRLKNIVLQTQDPVHLKSLLIQHCNALAAILNRIYGLQDDGRKINEGLRTVNRAVFAALYIIWEKAEKDYAYLMDNEQYVPINELEKLETKVDEGIQQVNNIKAALEPAENENLAEIIRLTLVRFLDMINRGQPVSRRLSNYMVNALKIINTSMFHESSGTGTLTFSEQFVALNINDVAAKNALKVFLESYLGSLTNDREKQTVLRRLIKSYYGIITDPDMIYNNGQESLKEWITEYLSREIDLLDHHLKYSNADTDGQLNAENRNPVKVLCNLSTDQLALILRAADDSDVITAKSLNKIFKTIVPYISTLRKENISWESMRVKSYTGEDRDKKIAIAFLQTMIEKIREY